MISLLCLNIMERLYEFKFTFSDNVMTCQLTFSWFSIQTFSIFLSGKLIPYILCNESFSVSPSQFVAECLVAAKALIRPVLGTCGPRHKSTRSPHRYIVVRVPSGILVDIICSLKGLPLNISNASSFVTTMRSNFCFSFTIFATSASTVLSRDLGIG